MAPAATDFVERTPVPERAPAVQTKVQVLFDDDALYVGLWMEMPKGVTPRALELQRDAGSIWADEAMTVKLDVRLDQRTTLGFAINPAGTQMDYIALQNGLIFRREHDAVWSVGTQVFDGGWSAEVRLPAAALGFAKGDGPRDVGLAIARDYNHGRAVYYWPYIPPELPTTTASAYGRLAGIRGIGGGRPYFVNPFVLGADAGGPSAPRPGRQGRAGAMWACASGPTPGPS